MEDKILTIPAVALRGMTILPGMVAHFDISRDKSLRAVEEAMKGDQKLFIVTQKDTEKEDPRGYLLRAFFVYLYLFQHQIRTQNHP